MMARDGRPVDGERAFECGLLPRLARVPFFRPASADEIDGSYEAYCGGDFARLCDVWCEVAQPTRAELGDLIPLYDRARWAPARVNGLAFLATVRAVLRAGEALRARLSARTGAALEQEFPWLERRHEHIPPGWTPPFRFPDEFRLFIDALGIDDARARWQLCAGMNEVQQQWYSQHAAERFGVPELARHGARERALAINYFSHWAPRATRALWRQVILMLDALNAATFDLICNQQRGPMVRHSVAGMVTRRGEWRAFVDGLRRPQRLLEPSVY
jgi:hypothetical protein